MATGHLCTWLLQQWLFLCFTALASSLSQRSLAPVPTLLAACPGQLVQEDVCSMSLHVEPVVLP